RPGLSRSLALQGDVAPDARGDRGGAIRLGTRGGRRTVSGPAPIRLKLGMAGEATVGKTSLIRRYVLDEYDDRYIATLGTKITKKVMSVQDPMGAGPVTVHAILWDIMGTPTLRDLLKEAYYHGAEGIFAVADQTRKETLAALRETLVDRIEFRPHGRDLRRDRLHRLALHQDPGEQVRDLPHLRLLHPQAGELLCAEADPGRPHRRGVPGEEVLVRDDARLLQVRRDLRAAA